MLQSAFVLGSTRTPFGKYGKGLAKVRPDDLASTALTNLVTKFVADPELIDSAIFGDANGAGEGSFYITLYTPFDGRTLTIDSLRMIKDANSCNPSVNPA
jgi:acetyl-CoA acetyltransferase